MLSLAILLSRTTVDPALPFLCPLFADGMVLQRGKADAIWGWTNPGETVQLQVADRKAQAVADSSGKWLVRLTPPKTGGPYKMTIDGSKHVELHDVMVGDVWLCGGQSNMQLGLFAVRDAESELAAANHPEIRFFQVRQQTGYAPKQGVTGSWQACSPQTAGSHSAVAYFFAQELERHLHVPIGLIEDCSGGTTAETWASTESLRKMGDFDTQIAEVEKQKSKGAPEYGNYVMHWYDDYDAGSKGATWADPTLDDSDWQEVKVPGAFAQFGVEDVPAVVWFRKTVTLPDPLPSGNARLLLGQVEQMDTTTVNGQWVGASAWVENPRVYFLRPGVLKPGKNLITIRDFKVRSKEGFLSPPDTLKLVLGDGTSIPLAGDWKAKLAVDARPPHPMPLSFENWPVMPGALFNGMIGPVAPYGIRGAIWYQGEANAPRAAQYRRLLPIVISDWRHIFGQGDFPFYVVSLPYFGQRATKPSTDGWAEIRESQAVVASHVKNSGLAVTVDTGDANNIHPRDKKVVGQRLAYVALAKEFHENVKYEGPTFTSAEIVGSSIKLHFAHAEGGLVTQGGVPTAFAVAGSDQVWHWAEATVDGAIVSVNSQDVPSPVAARYAWAGNPPPANLYNRAGLPMVPFRTDNW